MVGKFYAIRSEASIKKGTIISTAFALIVAGGCYFLGGFGRLYGDSVVSADGKVNFDGIIPTMLSDLSPVIVAIVIVLVLSASMSTLSSLVLTSSSTLTLDVIMPRTKKKSDEKKQVLIMRVFIVFFIIVSAVIAIVKDTFGFTFIAQMMGVSWGALAGAFLAPFLYGLYWKRTTKAGVIASFITGCGIEILQLYISLSGNNFSIPVLNYLFASSIRSGTLAMVVGLVIVPIVSLISKSPEKSVVENAFAGYDSKVQVSKKKNLGD
jgi:SSS family solute:Na+ symporter